MFNIFLCYRNSPGYNTKYFKALKVIRQEGTKKLIFSIDRFRSKQLIEAQPVYYFAAAFEGKLSKKQELQLKILQPNIDKFLKKYGYKTLDDALVETIE